MGLLYPQTSPAPSYKKSRPEQTPERLLDHFYPGDLFLLEPLPPPEQSSNHHRAPEQRQCRSIGNCAYEVVVAALIGVFGKEII